MPIELDTDYALLVGTYSDLDALAHQPHASSIGKGIYPDARFLYVSNRGGNSLAVFKVLDDSSIERIALVPTGGKFPRHFSITPCGKAVIVANQDSSHLTLFHRDIDTGMLTSTGAEYEIPAPNYIRFLGKSAH